MKRAAEVQHMGPLATFYTNDDLFQNRKLCHVQNLSHKTTNINATFITNL